MRWSPAFPCRRSERWVLVVRAGGAGLFRGTRRAVRAVADFTADEAGYAELRRNVERAAPRPIHVLVDLVEEDFRHETAPHVHGLARRSILETRSARLFPGTPFVSARREGRMPDGRRDDRILFSAIVRPERVEPWLDALREHAVAGIHSLPMVSAGLLPFLGAGSGPVLLVTESGDRDLRQTCFENGRLTLSRLATLPPGGPAERARHVVMEVERLVHHLGRSEHSTEGLGFRLVAGAALLAALRDSELPDELAEGLVDTAAVERRLGGRSRPRTADRDRDSKGGSKDGSDRMFAHLALNRPLPNHYATAPVLAVHRTKQAGRALGTAGVAMLLAGAALGGAAWHRSGELAVATEALEREASGIEARYRAERLPASEVGPDDLRVVVEAAERIDAGRIGALPILRTASEALAGFPDLEIGSLEWFEISDRDGWPSPPAEEAPRERFRVVHLRGRVEPFTGHYRAAADEVFRFVERLEATPGLSGVDVIDLPRDGDDGNRRRRPNAGFELRMVVDARDD